MYAHSAECSLYACVHLLQRRIAAHFDLHSIIGACYPSFSRHSSMGVYDLGDCSSPHDFQSRSEVYSSDTFEIALMDGLDVHEIH